MLDPLSPVITFCREAYDVIPFNLARGAICDTIQQ